MEHHYTLAEKRWLDLYEERFGVTFKELAAKNDCSEDLIKAKLCGVAHARCNRRWQVDHAKSIGDYQLARLKEEEKPTHWHGGRLMATLPASHEFRMAFHPWKGNRTRLRKI